MPSSLPNGLTSQLGTYTAQVELLIDLVEFAKPHNVPLDRAKLKTFRDRHRSEYSKLNERFCRVVIRLDANKNEELYQALNELHQVFLGDCANISGIREAKTKVLLKAQAFRTTIWEHIREGDLAFKQAKAKLSLVVTFAIGIALVFMAATLYRQLAPVSNSAGKDSGRTAAQALRPAVDGGANSLPPSP